MKTKVLLAVLASASLLLTGLAVAPASASVDIYVTEGYHNVNGREWRTTCEKYSSSINRCRTEIKAQQIQRVNNRFVETNGWVFNNLTYKPVARHTWGTNPLANTGSWTAGDSRQWRTECDTALTGRNGCRSFTKATVYFKSGTTVVQESKWVFNNMVRFDGSSIPAQPPTPAKPPAPATQACASTPSGGRAVYADKKAEDCIFAAINKDRVAAGKKPMIRDARLHPVAENWTMKMVSASGTSGYFHNPKFGAQTEAAVRPTPITGAAENIGWTSGDFGQGLGTGIHKMFMDSPPHRANVMNGDYTVVAVAVVCRTADANCFVTENFAGLR